MITLDIEAVADVRWGFAPLDAMPKTWKGAPKGWSDMGEIRKYEVWKEDEFTNRSKRAPHKSLVVCCCYSVIDDPFSDDEPPVITLSGTEAEMCEQLIEHVLPLAEEGHSLLAWNGAYYDFRWLQWMAARNGRRDLARLFNWGRNKPWDRVLIDPKRDIVTFEDKFAWNMREACLVTGYTGDMSSLSDGSEVARWWVQGRIDRIVHHCQLDVLAFNHVVKTFIRNGMIEVPK